MGGDLDDVQEEEVETAEVPDVQPSGDVYEEMTPEQQVVTEGTPSTVTPARADVLQPTTPGAYARRPDVRPAANDVPLIDYLRGLMATEEAPAAPREQEQIPVPVTREDAIAELQRLSGARSQTPETMERIRQLRELLLQ